VEPALGIQNSLVGLAVVAWGDVFASEQDFAIGRDADFDSSDGLADAALLRLEGVVQGGDGAVSVSP